MKKNRLYFPISLEYKHFLRIMKLSFILSFACLITVSAGNSYSQATKFTFNIKNGTVRDVFQEIEKNSQFIFIYYEKLLDLDRNIDLNVDAVPIEIILDKILQGTQVTYTIIDRQIVFSQKKELPHKNEITPVQAEPQRITVNGTVKDGSTGEPMAGVNIQVEGTAGGVVSGTNGEYSIMVPDTNSVLVYSFVGYRTQKVKVSSQQIINISLSVSATKLDEVVVTAQRKGQKQAMLEQMSSNKIVNVVAPDRLQENPDANAAEAIGRLPGISLVRSGGEGTILIVRGLEPKYTTVTMNGIALPSTDLSSRSTNINGISQYMLQGVEVYKSITPDMEANSVAGTINLKLKETPQGTHFIIMGQGGYNALNNYFGNYKFTGDISNRFFKDKLGISFSVNAERVNRSTQTMNANYSANSTVTALNNIYITNASLTNIYDMKYRRSAMVSMDYKLLPSTRLKLYGLYAWSTDFSQIQSHNYSNLNSAGRINYSFNEDPDNTNKMLQTCLSGETKLDFFKLEYGVSYSSNTVSDPHSRNWSFSFFGANTIFSDSAVKNIYPSEAISKFKSVEDSMQNLILNSWGIARTQMQDKNIAPYLHVTIPFKIGSFLSGYLKFGGAYRVRRRTASYVGGGTSSSYEAKYILLDSLHWLQRNTAWDDGITAVPFVNGEISNFLNGEYNFGNSFSFDRLNEVTDEWIRVSDYWYAKGPAAYLPVFGEKGKISFTQDIQGMTLRGQDITEYYQAAYAMTELNAGKWLMILPGVRYEATRSTMYGRVGKAMALTGPILDPLPGKADTAERSDHLILPMIQSKITLNKFIFFHLAYTQTLSRPNFDVISPNTYVANGYPPFTYITGNPQLRLEHWYNYDARITFHGSKIGLFSISAFYKTVIDKIYTRSYTRIYNDPLVPNFNATDAVNVTVTENHQYPVYVKGAEAEWQTSFWYLPKPFNYFTLYINYTYTRSETHYPYSYTKNIYPPGGGRPTIIRCDTTSTGAMVLQPSGILNASLGFNRKGFNAWLSFQFNGSILLGKSNYRVPELDYIQNDFYRWDLQVTQKINIAHISGFDLIANVANLGNFTEKTTVRADPRPVTLNSYGLTVDVGLRFRF